MDEVEFSVAEASHILKKTMKSLGYSSDLADLGVWSAVWLEKRLNPGISQLIVYMILVHELDFDDLKPKHHPEHRISGVCPFMLASFIASKEEILMSRGAVALGAPASTNLFAPVVAELVSLSGKSLRIKHEHYSCLYSQDGMSFETEQFGAWGMVNPDENGPMLLEVSDDTTDGMRKLEKIKLPAIRLRDDGMLNLG